MTTFLGFAALFWICVFGVLAGVVVYLKRRGVLRAAANAAADATKTAVTQDVQAVAAKVDPPK